MRGDRLTITISQWGREVVIHSNRPGSRFKLSDDKHTATAKFLDDETRGKKFSREGQRKKKISTRGKKISR